MKKGKNPRFIYIDTERKFRPIGQFLSRGMRGKIFKKSPAQNGKNCPWVSEGEMNIKNYFLSSNDLSCLF
jgi:hypothetical protein